jgi:hypothetical protein
MGTQLNYRNLIKNLILEYAKLTPAHGDIKSSISFDDEHNSYALLQIGWHGDEYVHGAVIHVDLIDGKIWIQYDGTEDGIATELVTAGVPKEDIVLGFRHPKLRQHTGFAVA